MLQLCCSQIPFMRIHLSKLKPFLLVVLFFTNCGPAQKITHSWKNPAFTSQHAFKKIFVAALVKNPHVRTHLEEEMGIAAAGQGFTVERSLDYFPPTFKVQEPGAREKMMEKIKSLQCDLIFTIALVDKQSEARYVPGNMGLYGPFPAYGLRFRGFYSYWYPYMYDPGYYVTDKTYLMEGNLFETSTESLIWSVQTETLNPPSIEKFSKKMINLMLKKAIEDLAVVK